MYKVFFNECCLTLASEFKNSSKDNICQIIDIEDFENFSDLLLRIETGQYVAENMIDCKIAPELIEKLIERMTKIPAAGGLVRNASGQILFIKRFGRWDLPKGKIEKEESMEEAAVREVEEECGLSQLNVIRKLPSTHHIYRSPYIRETNNLVFKETSWFEMFHEGTGTLTPQYEEHIEEVRWFNPDEITEVYASTYGNLKVLLDYYLA